MAMYACSVLYLGTKKSWIDVIWSLNAGLYSCKQYTVWKAYGTQDLAVCYTVFSIIIIIVESNNVLCYLQIGVTNS